MRERGTRPLVAHRGAQLGSGRNRTCLRGHRQQIAGYFAIVPHQVRRADIPSSVGHGGPTTIPGFLLARLAIRRDLQGEGRGGELLVLALERILEAIAIAGGRIIVVDALDDRAAAFYRHFGFAAAALGADRLVMKASRAAATLGVEWG